MEKAYIIVGVLALLQYVVLLLIVVIASLAKKPARYSIIKGSIFVTALLGILPTTFLASKVWAYEDAANVKWLLISMGATLIHGLLIYANRNKMK
jgi:hypothetical protein